MGGAYRGGGMERDATTIRGGIAALLCDPSIKIGLSAFPRTSDVVDPMRALWILASLFPFVYFLISLTWMDTTVPYTYVDYPGIYGT
jgi:hypothetical protein